MIRVYILSHERPEHVLNCIRSVEAAASIYHTAEIVISENSPTDTVYNLLLESDLRARVIRRRRYMSAVDHMNLCLTEAKNQNIHYVCMFHDDDLMGLDFLSLALEGVYYGDKIAALCFDIARETKTVRSANKPDIIDALFDVGKKSVIPFPGFIYNLHVLGEEKLNASVGKHCDAEFLLRVAEKGSIKIIESQQLISGVHEGSDSYTEDIRSRKRLVNAVISRHGVSKDKLRPFRISYILRKKALNYVTWRFLLSPRLSRFYLMHIFSHLRQKLSM